MVTEETLIDSIAGPRYYLQNDIRQRGLWLKRNSLNGAMYMSTEITGQTGPFTLGDNSQGNAFRQTRTGEMAVTEVHGRYSEQVNRGNVFIASTASTGIALIVPATTGNHPTLWNPLGSGVNINIIAVRLGYVSGTAAAFGLEWAITQNAGAQAATGAPIATFTQVAVVSALSGAGVNGKARWAPTTNTFTAAPVFYDTIGFGSYVTSAVVPWPLLATHYDGGLGIAQGNALSVCAQQTTTTAVFQVSILYEEVPA